MDQINDSTTKSSIKSRIRANWLVAHLYKIEKLKLKFLNQAAWVLAGILFFFFLVENFSVH